MSQGVPMLRKKRSFKHKNAKKFIVRKLSISNKDDQINETYNSKTSQLAIMKKEAPRSQILKTLSKNPKPKKIKLK
jgi:hypothetical protein